MDTGDKCLELERYANLCGDELGETAKLLTQLWCYRPYLDPKTVEALEAEISSTLLGFKETTRIVEETETFTKTWEVLEHL